MMTSTALRFILTGTALLGSGAFAQATSGTTPPTRESLRELHREAARATLESQFKPADRAAFQKLQSELQALQDQAMMLREKALRTYTEAVRAGKAPSVARADANAAVAQEAAALQQRRANLLNDARPLLQQYPNLTRSFPGGRTAHGFHRDGKDKREMNCGHHQGRRFDRQSDQRHFAPRQHRH